VFDVTSCEVIQWPVAFLGYQREPDLVLNPESVQELSERGGTAGKPQFKQFDLIEAAGRIVKPFFVFHPVAV